MTAPKPSFPSVPLMPRRDFVMTAASLATGVALGIKRPLSAAERRRSAGSNDRLRIGIIGCGGRGVGVLMEWIHEHATAANCEIVAVCDPWRLAREAANAKVREWFGRDARQFVSYRDLLAMEGLDAVMIASPDHLHTTHLEAAAKAGKHIYVEKPLANEMDKLLRAVDAVKQAGTVVQVGTQIRSLPGVVGARELWRSGILGKPSRIEECRNNERPYWYKRHAREVREEDVDWKEFLGDAPMRPFNPVTYAGWYGYYEFSKGPISQYGPHFIDLVHYITGAGFPESCVCLGGSFTWKDEFEFTAPDCMQATWIYPEGFLLSSSNNMGNSFGNTRKFYCDKGVLKADNWAALTYSAEGAPRRDGKIRGQNEVPPIEQPHHCLDWLQCIRTGGTPNAPIEAGYQHAIAVLMAKQSFETGRKTIYDRKNRIIRAA